MHSVAFNGNPSFFVFAARSYVMLDFEVLKCFHFRRKSFWYSTIILKPMQWNAVQYLGYFSSAWKCFYVQYNYEKNSMLQESTFCEYHWFQIFFQRLCRFVVSLWSKTRSNDMWFQSMEAKRHDSTSENFIGSVQGLIKLQGAVHFNFNLIKIV